MAHKGNRATEGRRRAHDRGRQRSPKVFPQRMPVCHSYNPPVHRVRPRIATVADGPARPSYPASASPSDAHEVRAKPSEADRVGVSPEDCGSHCSLMRMCAGARSIEKRGFEAQRKGGMPLACDACNARARACRAETVRAHSSMRSALRSAFLLVLRTTPCSSRNLHCCWRVCRRESGPDCRQTNEEWRKRSRTG